MRPVMARHDEILRSAIRPYGGHIFRTTGDAFHAAFSSPAAAVAAALEAQRTLTLEDFSSVGGLKVRMAIHSGPVESRDNDYFGQGINRVARLLSVTYGGQVLISGTAAVMMQGAMPPQASLFDLGRHRLPDLAEAQQVYQLVAPDLAVAFPPLRSLEAKIYYLPRPMTSFVGREAERAEIKNRLARYPLVTLIGSGGCGKTRVALQVGFELLDEYRDGIWFLDLAPLSDPSVVAETLCGVIGMPVDGSRTAINSAIGFLREKRALIILDNCEHLVTAVAALTETLVRECPGVSALATSREPLAISGESTFRIPSLPVPAATENLRASAALGYGAIQLFTQRAAAIIDDFTLTDANASAVANICSQVDGIPLAIELAAPRLKMMRPERLAEGLRDRFRMLGTGTRTAIPRHQTLKTLFDWSYNLLDEREQALLRRLSVFAGGWTLDSATFVAMGAPYTEQDLFELLSSLVDKSLVIAELSGPEPRYRLLETTRQYASGKLRESGERGHRRRLATYMVQFYSASDKAWPTMPTQAWRSQFEVELDNLRVSLEWAFGPEGDALIGMELAGWSLRVWDELSLLHEQDRWFSSALAFQQVNLPPAMEARLWLGRTSHSSHGDRTSFAAAERAAALFRECKDPLLLGEALTKAGAATLTPETTLEASPYLDEALSILQPMGPTKQLASCLRSKAVSTYFSRDFPAGRELINQSLAAARAVGDAGGVVNAQIALSELEYAAGSPETATKHTRELINDTLRNRRQLTLGLGNLTSYLLGAGKVEEARLTAFSGLHEARALGWLAAVVRVVEHLALIALLRGDVDRAARLFGFTVAFYAQGSASREYTEQTTYDRLVDVLRRRLSDERRDQLMSEGARWTEQQAIDAAMQA